MSRTRLVKMQDYFSEVTDPRRRKVTYPLVNIITIAIRAVICGADDFVAIAAFGRKKRNWLSKFLDLSTGIPSHDRFHAIVGAINHDKSSICRTEDVEYLGYRFRGFGGRLEVSAKKLRKFKDRVKEITRRTGGRSMSSRLLALRRYFQGWIGYFHYGLRKTQLQNLDQWVRRRIRACYWKQWYRVRTRIRMLLKLGVRQDEAISHGSSGRGYWVMSSSAASPCRSTTSENWD